MEHMEHKKHKEHTEHKEHKEHMEHMRVREATFSDFRSIVVLADRDLYGGLDYLPAMFYELLHSKRHKVVVFEDNRTGRIIGLIALEFCEEERRFVLGFAGRIHSSARGQGFWGPLLRLVRDYSLTVQPLAKTLLTVAPLSDAFRLTKIHYIWNCLLYKFFVNDLPQGLRCPSRTGGGSSSGQVRRVTYAESVERLSRDDSFQNFFQQFSNEFIPSGCNRRAQPISRQGLRELFSTAELYVSEDVSQLAENGPSPAEEVVGVTTKPGEIQAVSYLASVPVDCGLGVHAFLYGFDVEDLVQHVRGHLNHVASIWKEGVVGFMIVIPICIDLTRFESRIRETIGDAFREPHERHLKTVLGSSMPYWPSSYSNPLLKSRL